MGEEDPFFLEIKRNKLMLQMYLTINIELFQTHKRITYELNDLVGASPNECPLVAHFSGFWGWLLGDHAQSQSHYKSKK